MARTSAHLLDLALALAVLLAVAGASSLRAAEWPSVREGDTLYPGAPLGDEQWPDVPAATIATINSSTPRSARAP